jgi:hypothetical protein
MSQGNNPSASARNAGRAEQAPSAALRGMKMPHPKSPTSSRTQGTPCSVLTTTSYWRSYARNSHLRALLPDCPLH